MKLPELASTLRGRAGRRRQARHPGRGPPLPRPARAAPGASAACAWATTARRSPTATGYLLLAAEGMWPALVASEPRFAGYCAVHGQRQRHLRDGRPAAGGGRRAVRAGRARRPSRCGGGWPRRRAASASRSWAGTPTCAARTRPCRSAILGRARRLLTSFDASPGDELVAAIDLRGRDAPAAPVLERQPARRRPSGCAPTTKCCPHIAEAGLAAAGKDISMGGAGRHDADAARGLGRGRDAGAGRGPPAARAVPLERWLLAFPSYGFVLSVAARAARRRAGAVRRARHRRRAWSARWTTAGS